MKDYIILVQDLLADRNNEFDATDKKRVRLIRHKDNRTEKVIDGKSYRSSLYDLYLHEHNVFKHVMFMQIQVVQGTSVALSVDDLFRSVVFVPDESDTFLICSVKLIVSVCKQVLYQYDIVFHPE